MMNDVTPVLSKQQFLSVCCFCAATVLLIPLEMFYAGAVVWALGVITLFRQHDAGFRRRMGVLFVCIALLSVAPIHTDRSNAHFLWLSLFFGAVVIVPFLILRKTDPGAIDYRFWPEQLRRMDILYTLISIPLAWIVLSGYFFWLSPEVPDNWPMPQPYTSEGRLRLFVGINAVGIWDELFFVNTVFAILRSCMPFRYANIAQAFVYTSVLNDMAFTGIGPFVVGYFALTQGFMYEKSKCLFYVLLVHIIVDYFLIEAILYYHYPDMSHVIRWLAPTP
jgi:hypothetical protein